MPVPAASLDGRKGGDSGVLEALLRPDDQGCFLSSPDSDPRNLESALKELSWVAR